MFLFARLTFAKVRLTGCSTSAAVRLEGGEEELCRRGSFLGRRKKNVRVMRPNLEAETGEEHRVVVGQSVAEYQTGVWDGLLHLRRVEEETQWEGGGSGLDKGSEFKLRSRKLEKVEVTKGKQRSDDLRGRTVKGRTGWLGRELETLRMWSRLSRSRIEMVRVRFPLGVTRMERIKSRGTAHVGCSVCSGRQVHRKTKEDMMLVGRCLLTSASAAASRCFHPCSCQRFSCHCVNILLFFVLGYLMFFHLHVNHQHSACSPRSSAALFQRFIQRSQ